MTLDNKTLLMASGPNYAALTTLFKNGVPQTHVMWVDTDGENILINTEIHRVKYKNVKIDPRVTVMIWKHDNPFKFVES
jgi:general stress protein 26